MAGLSGGMTGLSGGMASGLGGGFKLGTSASMKPEVSSTLNRFQSLFKKDLITMQKGGIPKFKRANFARSIDSIKNGGQDTNKEPETFSEKFTEKTKKLSYPIAWIDYFKDVGKG